MKTIFSMSGFLVAIVLMLFAVIVALNFTTGEKKIEQSVERLYAAADPAFARAMGVLLGPAILPGNRFEALLNGDRIFPAMLAAIRDAKKTITFESYIYWSDAIGKEFADALTERARAGVKVHVLLDWVGSNKMDPTHLAAMEAAGVEVRKFHKPDWYSLARMNNRTHRKVLVVDGKLGFTGGVGIAGLWTGDAQDPQHWRDTHFRAEGPVGHKCSQYFSTTGSRPPAPSCTATTNFPELPATGNDAAQMFSSSPSGGQREHASYVSAGDSGGATFDPLVECLFCPRQAKYQGACRCAQRGCQGADHRARRAQRRGHRPERFACPMGATCWPPAPRFTSTSRRCITARC
jgi:cardiolipin synthase